MILPEVPALQKQKQLIRSIRCGEYRLVCRMSVLQPYIYQLEKWSRFRRGTVIMDARYFSQNASG